jgi:Carbohydrate family 9 binding domain-like/PA14 domain
MALKRYRLIPMVLLLLSAGRVCAQFGGDGLKGIYYIDADLTNPAVTVVDPVVSYRWGGCSPQPGMSGASFSVRWTGRVEPSYSEPYTFIVDVNGGVSVIVNGQVLVNQWIDYPPPIMGFSGVVTLTAGVKVPIEVDYFTNGANPTSDRIQLVWQSPSQGNEYIPREDLFSGATLTPTPTPQTPSSCQASVTVDGVLNEWAWNTPGEWNTVNRTVLGNIYGTTAVFKTLWDSSNLYLGVTVTDSQLTNTGTASLWENSTVELYLDPTDAKSVTLNNNDFEYFFRWNDTAAGETQGRTAGVSMHTTTIPTGYVVEASIPWSTLGLGSPAPGTVLGFDIGVDVDHNGGNCRDGQMIWNGGSDDYMDASGYAQLSLADACPTPVSTPPAPIGGNPYVAPNPSDGDTVVFVYTMAAAGTAKIKVWNAWGNLVATLGDPKGPGLQSSALNVASFAPGHYFYRVELVYGSGQKDTFRTQVLAIKK